MLHKSFKSAKCKTALKLATSRIKLMKNKKGVQMNQMKRDLAQLLQTGQDRTARIRVEHVIREEKTVAAYELIEIYCELIAARLPIIESQKTCPIDLKEAVTSVIFAAPRCSDISELSDIKKQFTAKYGKEFVTAAIELRPDCGVSRMLVEKLSAVAPNLQTKIKVLSDVAKEHNIDWDATSFEEKESKPPNDLLNGPVNIEKASIPNTDLSKIQPSNISVVHSHEEKQNTPFDFSEQNRKYTLGTQNVTLTDNDVGTSSAATHQDTSSSGINSERMETRQPISRGDNDFSSGRENWNMEFKDATSAAQAAAESAERAALAARAAAQFSNQEKIAKHRQTGSHVSNFTDETSRVSKDSYESYSDDRKPKILNQHIDQNQHDTSQKTTAQFSSHEETVKQHQTGSHVNIRDETPLVSKDSYESALEDRKPKIPNQHIDRTQQHTSQKTSERFHRASHDGDIRSTGPTSFRSNNDSFEDKKLVNNFHMEDGYFEEYLHEDQEGPFSPERESKIELGSGPKESYETENINFFAEETTKKLPGIHSSTSSEEPDVSGHQKLGKRSVVGNPFAVIDQGSPFKEVTKTNSSIDSRRDDDDDDDDDDVGPRFDSGGFDYDEVEATQSLANAHIWSPKNNTVDQLTSQSHLFSESLSFGEHSVKSMETEDHVASFDHSDGLDTESESESESEFFSVKPNPSSVESSQNSSSKKSRIELNDLVEVEPSFDNPEDEEKRLQSQHELKKHNLDQDSYDTLENNDSLNQPNDLELNFGTLTGGLRNKDDLTYPPYTKSATNDSLYLSKKSIEGSSVTGGQTFLQSSLDSRVSKMEDKKPNISILSSYSDSDVNASKHTNIRSRFSAPAAFFNDDESDPKMEVSKQVASKVQTGSGISRRTRGSPSVSYSKTNVDPEPKIVISSFGKNSSEFSYSDEIPAEPRFSAPRRFKEDNSKQISETQPFSPSRKTAEIGSTEGQRKPSKRSDYINEIKTVEKKPESKIPTHEPVPSRIAVESGKTKTAKSEKLLGENLVKNPSHVHPKLPDYDSLAARLQSLRNDD